MCEFGFVKVLLLSCVNWTCEGLKQNSQVLQLVFPHPCELNLWGIETAVRTDWRNCPLGVWIEPVRDWNYISVPLSSYLKTCVNWTCEGLKLFYISPILIIRWWCELNLWGIETRRDIWVASYPQIVWIEPVRDWNGNTGLFWQAITGVWIEPVRDWNTLPLTTFAVDGLGVNWTCEGLKHSIICKIPNRVVLCELNLWGIETYKGKTWFLWYSVWIEPVRDWNAIWNADVSHLYFVWIEPVRDWNGACKAI